VLEGRLVEHESPVAAVHLADLDSDPSESRNLADSEPEVTAELKYLAEEWRATVEKRWLDEFGAPDVAQRRMPD